MDYVLGNGNDRSEHNDWLNPGWASELDFCIIRAGYGAANRDKRFNVNWEVAGNDPDLIRGPYWYIYANRSGPEAQIDAFWSIANDVPNAVPYGQRALDLRPALDWEGPEQQSLDWLLAAGVHLKDHYLGGAKPILYSLPSKLGETGGPVLTEVFDLWIAHWGVRQPDTKWWPEAPIWQTGDASGYGGDSDVAGDLGPYFLSSTAPPVPQQHKESVMVFIQLPGRPEVFITDWGKSTTHVNDPRELAVMQHTLVQAGVKDTGIRQLDPALDTASVKRLLKRSGHTAAQIKTLVG